MSMSDPLADMLTRIRNGGSAKLKKVIMPNAKIKVEIAKVLKKEGYILDYQSMKDSKQGILKIFLKYDKNNQNVIRRIIRVSKPSRRVYMGSKEVKPYYNGLGTVILTTSKGIMTDRTAHKENVGGEVICKLW